MNYLAFPQDYQTDKFGEIEYDDLGNLSVWLCLNRHILFLHIRLFGSLEGKQGYL